LPHHVHELRRFVKGDGDGHYSTRLAATGLANLIS
jgi:hypothetical protein